MWKKSLTREFWPVHNKVHFGSAVQWMRKCVLGVLMIVTSVFSPLFLKHTHCWRMIIFPYKTSVYTRSRDDLTKELKALSIMHFKYFLYCLLYKNPILQCINNNKHQLTLRNKPYFIFFFISLHWLKAAGYLKRPQIHFI